MEIYLTPSLLHNIFCQMRLTILIYRSLDSRASKSWMQPIYPVVIVILLETVMSVCRVLFLIFESHSDHHRKIPILSKFARREGEGGSSCGGRGWVGSPSLKEGQGRGHLMDLLSPSSPVNRVTHTSENITFPRTTHLVGKNCPKSVLYRAKFISLSLQMINVLHRLRRYCLKKFYLDLWASDKCHNQY